MAKCCSATIGLCAVHCEYATVWACVRQSIVNASNNIRVIFESSIGVCVFGSRLRVLSQLLEINILLMVVVKDRSLRST
jgi:hypothetical protein